MYGAVVRYLEHEVAPRLFSGSSDQFCAAAALTEMAGWMAHDAGDDTLAHQHFERAQRFASATDDCELAAHIHASLSHLSQQLDRPRDGLRVAQAGRAVLRRREHHSGLAARLHAMEARALAALRRRADCERALLAADRALDRSHPAPPSTWVSPFDRASLAAEASVCMQQLQQLAAARSHSEQVIRLRSNGRSRALGQFRLAAILASQGEVEVACAVSNEALASSDPLSSRRVTQLVQSAQLYERDPEAWNAYLAEGNAKQPRKRVAADVIIRTRTAASCSSTRATSRTGTYQAGWSRPTSADRRRPPRAPRRAGPRRRAGELLCIDWIAPHGPWDDTLVCVFDGGVLSRPKIEQLRITDSELAEFQFCGSQEAAKLLRPYVWQRASTALVVASGCARYVHRGQRPA